RGQASPKTSRPGTRAASASAPASRLLNLAARPRPILKPSRADEPRDGERSWRPGAPTPSREGVVGRAREGNRRLVPLFGFTFPDVVRPHPHLHGGPEFIRSRCRWTFSR